MVFTGHEQLEISKKLRPFTIDSVGCPNHETKQPVMFNRIHARLFLSSGIELPELLIYIYICLGGAFVHT